jgi:hypothetical protein
LVTIVVSFVVGLRRRPFLTTSSSQRHPCALPVSALSSFGFRVSTPRLAVSMVPRFSSPAPRNLVKSLRIRTSAKRACNPCRMRSFKTQDLKPFRMCSCGKTEVGEGPYPKSSVAPHPALLCVATSLLQILIQLHSFEYGTRLIRYPDFTPVTT